MKAWAFKGDLYCEDDAKAIVAALKRTTGEPPLELRGDSNVWPQFTGNDGGGEADYPCHCGKCGGPLLNPLTPDGETYVRDAIGPKRAHKAYNGHYDYVFETKS